MKRMRFLLLALFIAILAMQTFTAQATRVIGGWVPFYQGIEYATGTDDSPRLMKAFALRIDLQNPYVQMYASHDNGGSPYEVALQTTPAFVAEHGMKVAVNSCYFDAGLSPNTNIEGLLVSNGTVVSTWQAARDAEIRFTAGKVASIVNNGGTAGVYNGCAGDAYFLINGVPGGDNVTPQPRTTAGLSQDGRYVILVCVDGRQPGWSDGATILDMSYWQLSFGAYNAMNFDGGGSTTMSLAGWGSYVNRPCYGYARSVGASLGVASGLILNPPYLFDSGVDYWYAGNAVTAPYCETCCGWGGVLVTDQTGNDGFIYSGTTNMAGPYGPEVFSVNLYPQGGTTANHDMQLFWRTGAENTWTADKSTSIVNYTAQNNFTTVSLSVNYPKWWGQTINQLRLDFDQTNHGTRWIVNHCVKQNALWWYFAVDTMGWFAGNSLTTPWWTNCCNWPGILVTDQTGPDAYMYSPMINGAGFPFNYIGGCNDKVMVTVYPQNGSTANHDMRVYWITASDGTWTDSKSVLVNYTGQNQWVNVVFPVGNNSSWVTQHITQLRIDFDQVNHGNRWLVDNITTIY